jgi:hypothetical protein
VAGTIPARQAPTCSGEAAVTSQAKPKRSHACVANPLRVDRGRPRLNQGKPIRERGRSFPEAGLAEPYISHPRVHAVLISENKGGVFTSESAKAVWRWLRTGCGRMEMTSSVKRTLCLRTEGACC